MAITKAGRELATALSGSVDGLATPSECSALLRLAKRYVRIQERWCNDDMDDATRARLERTEARLEAQIACVAALVFNDGIVQTLFSGDPRGYCVRLQLHSGRSNNWGAPNTWGVA